MASSISWEEARDKLKKFREENRRCSDEIVELWEDYLSDFSYKLGDELWLIYEQVCIAALDCGRVDISYQCIDGLGVQFPGSLRVDRLKGLWLEAQEKFDDAWKLYEKILKADETDSLARKRKVSILKAQGKLEEAIKELNEYVKLYMADTEAWMELCDLFIQKQDFGRAAYCMEELILSNPHNHLYHQKFAEIKYTQGSHDNMEVSRSYFSRAVKLNPNNIRALFGLFMSASHLAASPKSNAKAKTDNIRYANWAAQQLSHRYKASRSKEQSSTDIEHMLGDLQITSGS